MAKFKFTVDKALELMKDRAHVRNLGIIAHIDHGKSTLCDSLLAESGLLSDRLAGEARATDTREDEQERGITIKTTGISLGHEYEDNFYVVNLQDTPGHVDFSGEVTAALRVVDGAVVVVDAVEGIMVQTETVTRQALQERVRPVLYINKVDRLILEMRMTPDAAYDRFLKIIDDFNNLISTYGDETRKEKWIVDPVEGTVAFGSAVHRFGLTIPSLAKIWAEKTGRPVEQLARAMWQKKNFVDGVLGPVFQIYDFLDKNDLDGLKQALEKIEVKLAEEEWRQTPKRIAKSIFEKWVPVEESILDMVCKFCPSPLEAQKYRVEAIWDGDMESDLAKSMLTCDSEGPVMITLSKMIPLRAKRIIAMGRVFSGTVKTGQRIHCLLPGYSPGSKDRIFTTNIQMASILMGKDAEKVEGIPAGNIVALAGLSGATASATVTTEENTIPFRALAYAVEPVVTIAIEPKRATELPKLVEGMRLMALVDPSLYAHINEETGEYLLAGTGELHLEIATKDLQDMQRIEVTQSPPIVVFRESVEGGSPAALVPCLLVQALQQPARSCQDLRPLFPSADGRLVIACLRSVPAELRGCLLRWRSTLYPAVVTGARHRSCRVLPTRLVYHR